MRISQLILIGILSVAGSGFQSASLAAASLTQSPIIAGVVEDQNGAPVPSATVTLATDVLTMGTTTDNEGQFRFSFVPQGKIVLKVRAPTFATAERRFDPRSDDTNYLRITLEPAPVSEQITVIATRTETRTGETAGNVTILNRGDLNSTAALTVDDALRQVPGLGLFRRSGSRTANPTAQGVSLRGLGASGASRAVVLADGLSLNDPFGGWVYWDRVPRTSISEVEVLLGGASHLYRSTALGGVVNIMTRRPDMNALELEASYGNEMTPNVSIFFGGRQGKWSGSVAAEDFRTKGYIPVAGIERGTVDTEANSRHAVTIIKGEQSFSSGARVFAAASFFGESRQNGTPLTFNRTHVREFSLGGEWQNRQMGTFTARAHGGTQVFDQSFTAVSADRRTESLTRLQRVLAQSLGLNVQWMKAIAPHQTFVAGFEARQVRGASDEIAFVSSRPSALIGAGGRQQTIAAYFEDLMKFGSRLFINAGARVDHWRNYNALSATRPLSATPGGVTVFPDRSETTFSPQVSVLYKLHSNVSLTASATRAFRAPTLNELYRSFRVGNVLTLANEKLAAERLTGGEAGMRLTGFKEKFGLRGTFFWNEITRPIANVTLNTMPSLITRQRQNLGRTRSRGLEIEAEATVGRDWNFSGGYLLADATVIRFPANVALEGLIIPQVPRHQFTLQARYTNPKIATIAFQARASSSQFDDDLNLFRLGPYFTLDALVSRRLNHRLEIFAAAENVLNQPYEVGKTPVMTLGPPILVRAGLRVYLGSK